MYYVWLEPNKMQIDVLEVSVRHINRLLERLSPREARHITSHHLKIIAAHGACILTACHQDTNIGTMSPLSAPRICGMATLVPIMTLKRYVARVEDVVVDIEYRGQGIGTKMMKRLIEDAKHNGFEGLELTSRPEREAANALYRKLGFVQRETNVYQMVL